MNIEGYKSCNSMEWLLVCILVAICRSLLAPIAVSYYVSTYVAWAPFLLLADSTRHLENGLVGEVVTALPLADTLLALQLQFLLVFPQHEEHSELCQGLICLVAWLLEIWLALAFVWIAAFVSSVLVHLPCRCNVPKMGGTEQRYRNSIFCV